MWLRDDNEPWADLTSEEMAEVQYDAYGMGWQFEIVSTGVVQITWNKEQPLPFTYRWVDDD